MAIEDIDGVAELSELRANPAAVAPALTMATVATTVTAANLRPGKTFPDPVGMAAPSPCPPASMEPTHERPSWRCDRCVRDPCHRDRSESPARR